jgi:hypothetical protein
MKRKNKQDTMDPPGDGKERATEDRVRGCGLKGILFPETKKKKLNLCLRDKSRLGSICTGREASPINIERKEGNRPNRDLFARCLIRYKGQGSPAFGVDKHLLL